MENRTRDLMLLFLIVAVMVISVLAVILQQRYNELVIKCNEMALNCLIWK